MSLLHCATFAPFLMAIIIPLLYSRVQRVHTGWFVLILPATLFVFFMSQLPAIRAGEVIQETLSWVPALGIHLDFYLDGFSLLFALLITGIGTLVILYSIYYLSKKEKLGNFYLYLMLFMGAMLGVVLSDNLIGLYAFWELTSVSSALLISYWYENEASTYGAQKSMFTTVFGGLAMLGGFILLSMMSGSFSLRETIASGDVVTSHALFLPAMIMILLGAFTKSAQFPFHYWLPDAMEAPTPVSAYLHSATMVKAGLYLVARMTAVFGGSAAWFWIVSGVGLVTLLWGSVSAVRQKDLKGILAFSTISQLGMIMSMLGVGSAAYYFMDGDNALYTTAILAAVFHLINHATFKGSLFMTVGIVDLGTGTRDIRRLGGLMSLMPITGTISLIGLGAMAGLPPFNGFLSKELFFTSMLNVSNYGIFSLETWGVLLPIVAWIASIFTFLYCLVFFFQTFMGEFTPDQLPVKKVKEAPFGMLVSPVILGALVIVIGLFPNILSGSLIQPAMQGILPGLLRTGQEFSVHIAHWHGFNLELFMTIGVVLLGVFLYSQRGKWVASSFYQGERDILNKAYDGWYNGMISTSKVITNVQMTGRLRDYLRFMSVFVILLMAYTMIKFGAFSLDFIELSPIEPHLWIVAIMMLVALLSVPFIKNRLVVMFVLGAKGYLVALFFIAFRASDLALTQLLVETVATVLFMLAFYHLPELEPEKSSKRTQIINAVISMAVGLMITIGSLSAFAFRQNNPTTSIAEFFLENGQTVGGASNVVNVILANFRGFDTMLEILVLGTAALSVAALIKYRKQEGEES